jgi:hypothetical protein
MPYRFSRERRVILRPHCHVSARLHQIRVEGDSNRRLSLCRFPKAQTPDPQNAFTEHIGDKSRIPVEDCNVTVCHH